jgi:hypothetical protein
VTRANDASSCLDAPRLVKKVQARLGRRVFVDEGATLLLKVAIERVDTGWIARLTLSDSLGVLGSRELTTDARHCSALDESLALVVALLVDTPPERVAPPTPASAPPVAGESPPPASPPRPRSTPLQIPADTFAPREPWSFDARLSATVAAGLVPSLGWGAEVGLGLRAPRGPWFRLLADLSPAREARLDDAERGARLSVYRAGLDVCGLDLRAGSFRVSWCVGQRVGVMRAEGFGFQENTDSQRLVFALGSGLDGIIPIGRYFGLSCGIRAELPFARDRFTGQGASGSETLIFRSAPLTVSARAGIQVQL